MKVIEGVNFPNMAPLNHIFEMVSNILKFFYF